jgi:site-specific DNA recombinase
MQESFDTATPFGRAMIGILSVFAQLEREQIRERTRMGRIARAKEGLRNVSYKMLPCYNVKRPR